MLANECTSFGIPPRYTEFVDGVKSELDNWSKLGSRESVTGYAIGQGEFWKKLQSLMSDCFEKNSSFQM